MPAYTWLLEDALDYSDIEKKIEVMRNLGVPYPEGYEYQAEEEIKAQSYDIAERIINDLSEDPTPEKIKVLSEKEVVALIAYMQRLGSDIHKAAGVKAIPYIQTVDDTSEEEDTQNEQ